MGNVIYIPLNFGGFLIPCFLTAVPIRFNGTLSYSIVYYSVVVVAFRLAKLQTLSFLRRFQNIAEWRAVMLLRGNRSQSRVFPSCSFSVLTLTVSIFLLINLMNYLLAVFAVCVAVSGKGSRWILLCPRFLQKHLKLFGVCTHHIRHHPESRIVRPALSLHALQLLKQIVRISVLDSDTFFVRRVLYAQTLYFSIDNFFSFSEQVYCVRLR